MRIWQLLCSGVLVLNMTGCGQTTAPVEKSTSTPEASVSSTTRESTPPSSGVKSSTDKTSGFAALQGVINSTKTAIEAGKLDAAKTEFAKFEDSWKTVEDGVKSKSGDNYKAVEDGMESVDKGIASKQGKDALLASLQKLSQSIDKASK